MKATFQLTMVRSPDYFTLFNMPLQSTSDYDKGLKKDEFQTTVKMSTYLVAFVVCDYKHITLQTDSNITVSISPNFLSIISWMINSLITARTVL